MSTSIAVLGLGEAGWAIASDLAAAGAVVWGFDPVVPGAPTGVQRRDSDAAACAEATIVLSVNSSRDARRALQLAQPGLHPEVIWADLNTAAPTIKAALAASAQPWGVEVVDVALMAPVPGRGLSTPMLVAGAAAPRFVEALQPFGARAEVLPGPPGAAISRKLLRSVFYKGLAAAVTEAMAGARAAGLQDWLYANIADELAAADATTIDRLLEGTVRHARRRTDEMAAASEQLADLGVSNRIAAATRDTLQMISDGQIPPE